MTEDVPIVAPASPFRPAFLSPPTLVQTQSVPIRSAPSALIHLLLLHGLRWKDRKGVKEISSKIQQLTRSYLSSSQTLVLLPGIVTEERQWTRGKERQRREAEKMLRFPEHTIPHLNFAQSGISPPPCTNSRNIDLESGQMKEELPDRSRERRLFWKV